MKITRTYNFAKDGSKIGIKEHFKEGFVANFGKMGENGRLFQFFE